MGLMGIGIIVTISNYNYNSYELFSDDFLSPSPSRRVKLLVMINYITTVTV